MIPARTKYLRVEWQRELRAPAIGLVLDEERHLVGTPAERQQRLDLRPQPVDGRVEVVGLDRRQRRVRDHLVELAAVRWMLRELRVDCRGQLSKGPVRLWREPH